MSDFSGKTKDNNILPSHWYNLAADLSQPIPPYLRRSDNRPLTPKDLSPILPHGLVEQEFQEKRWIPIPEEIREIYARYRPTPLYRAKGWEKTLGDHIRVYFKFEGASPTGSHKVNSAVAQAYYNKAAGVDLLFTDTGAGQWGVAVAYASSLFGIKSRIFMVSVSYEQKPYRGTMMKLWNADVLPSPSNETFVGRRVLAANPFASGSSSLSAAEAVEAAVASGGGRYAPGSLFNFVMLHQTVIGLEARSQMAQLGEKPDFLVGCVGAGSNFSGGCFPFLYDKAWGRNMRFIAAESETCPTLTEGVYGYDHADAFGHTPLYPMYSLGHRFVPPSSHLGGLRFHGVSPLLSMAVRLGLVEKRAYGQQACFKAGREFIASEGFIPAPETCHAIAAVKEISDEAKASGKSCTVLFIFSGLGLLDLSAYEAYLSGKIDEGGPKPERLQRTIADVRPL